MSHPKLSVGETPGGSREGTIRLSLSIQSATNAVDMPGPDPSDGPRFSRPTGHSPVTDDTARQETPLLPKVAAGAAGAVEAFLDRYSGAVWNLARRLCRNRTDAEDATQDVFVEIWRHAGRFDADAGGEWTFVLTIARRRLIDRLRRTSRRRDIAIGEVGSLTDSPATLELDSAVSPPDSAELSEDASIAMAALELLTRDQQSVIRLSLFEGMSYPEISEKLDTPLGTVKTHARRGLIKLRQILESDEESEVET